MLDQLRILSAPMHIRLTTEGHFHVFEQIYISQ
jgi:hypothetical protein